MCRFLELKEGEVAFLRVDKNFDSNSQSVIPGDPRIMLSRGSLLLAFNLHGCRCDQFPCRGIDIIAKQIPLNVLTEAMVSVDELSTINIPLLTKLIQLKRKEGK